jgi:hypothetical protein
VKIVNRLKKLAEENDILKERNIDLEVAKKAIDSLDGTIDNIINEYKNLFTKLNSISEEYKPMYEQLKKLIKFPTEYDTRDIVKMKTDLNTIKERYEDNEYLAGVIGTLKVEDI